MFTSVPVFSRQGKFRLTTALVCAYVLAVTTILSAWTGHGVAQSAGSLGVICTEHNAATGDLPAGGGHGNHQLCAMLCSLLGGSIDGAVVPSAVALPWRFFPAGGAPVWTAHTDPQPVFLKDRPVRGPPLHAAGVI